MTDTRRTWGYRVRILRDAKPYSQTEPYIVASLPIAAANDDDAARLGQQTALEYGAMRVASQGPVEWDAYQVVREDTVQTSTIIASGHRVAPAEIPTFEEVMAEQFDPDKQVTP